MLDVTVEEECGWCPILVFWVTRRTIRVSKVSPGVVQLRALCHIVQDSGSYCSQSFLPTPVRDLFSRLPLWRLCKQDLRNYHTWFCLTPRQSEVKRVVVFEDSYTKGNMVLVKLHLHLYTCLFPSVCKYPPWLRSYKLLSHFLLLCGLSDRKRRYWELNAGIMAGPQLNKLTILSARV